MSRTSPTAAVETRVQTRLPVSGREPHPPRRAGLRIDRADRRARVLLLAPALGVLGALVVVPLCYNVYLSLHDVPGSLTSARFVGGANFATLAGDGRFWAAAWRTVAFSGSAVAIETVLGVAIALALHRRFRGQRLLRSLFLLPMLATPVAISLVWRLMFQPQLGVLNDILAAVGASPLQWASDESLALPALVLVDVWEWTSLITLITVAGLAGLPTEPAEAAAVDGAGAWRRFWYITLPMLRPVIAVAVLMRLIEAFRTFDSIYVITGGGPGTATETLNIYAYKLTFQYLTPSYAATVVLGFIVIVLVLSLAVTRMTRRAE